jgi:hypothetical protein
MNPSSEDFEKLEVAERIASAVLMNSQCICRTINPLMILVYRVHHQNPEL